MAEQEENGRIQERSMITYTKMDSSAAPTPFSHRSPVSSHGSRLVRRSNGRSLLHTRGAPSSRVAGILKDSFTTIVGLRWWWVVLFFSALYMLSWLLFALTWWAMVAVYDTVSNTTCIQNVNDFPSAFLFSLETEVTIGYGHKFIRKECSVGIVVLCLQCLVGLFLDSFLLGLVFAKITRPRNRRKTILFSDRAVVYTKTSGERVLEFRIADIRRTQLVEAHVRLQMYWNHKAADSEETTLHLYDLDVGYDTGRDRIFLLTPVSIVHKINKTSPLWSLTSDSILDQDLEVVVILEAIVESTGLTVQALWSYTQEEIHFDYQFEPITYRQATGDHKWETNLNKLSETRPCRPSTGNLNH